MKLCKNCGEINPNDTLYCDNCGQSNFIIHEEVLCPVCGATNDKAYVYCINCGSTLFDFSDTTQSFDEEHAQSPFVTQEQSSGIFDNGHSSVPSEMAHCPHCDNLVPITAIFCPRCGTNVASLHSHRVVKRKVCSHCGSLNKLDADLCSYCFNSLDDATTQEAQVTHDSQNLGELIIRQAYLEGVGGKKLICPNCGTLNEPHEPFCLNCGLKLEVDEPKKYCPNCGAQNPSESAFCAKCRWSFEGDNPDSIDKWTCPYCDHVNDKLDSFCPNCGHKKA